MGALERGVYHRTEATMSLRDLEFSMRTAYGLPEFDTLGYRTALLIQGALGLRDSAPRHALLFNPGQGHVPVALWKLMGPSTIALVDRDLLSLRYSRDNLVLNGCPASAITLSHQVGIQARDQQRADLIAGVLREEERPEGMAAIMRQAAQQLSPDGTILIAGSSTAVTRLEKLVRSEKLLRVRKRKRSKGNSFLILGSRTS
jgi:16S rRNA G1207 methylase RsmC